MKILIFGGTTEGRLLAEALCRKGTDVTVSVATPLGAEELKGIPCHVLTGRLLEDEMSALFPEFDLIADATHPYAVVVSENIRNACHKAGVPLRRVLRSTSLPAEGDILSVFSCREAAEALAQREGNVLLTTGAKELGAFSSLSPERLYARVLPTHEGISACEALGLQHRHILALQGPFSEKMNEAMMLQYEIKWMVTKSSGKAGGFEEKVRAARNAGAGIVVVCPPQEEGIPMEDFLKEAEAW